jgi:hypothetical protein
MKYACQVCDEVLPKDRAILVTIHNPYYEERKFALCAIHAVEAFDWLDFSWTKL